MSTLNLWLIRHGETTANQGIWSNDPANIKLTANGIKQAEQAANQITSQPDLLILSPLKRAQESALPILERWPSTKVEIWPIQELIYLSPHAYQNKTDKERQLAKDNYWQRALPFFCDTPNTESFANFLKRVEDFYNRLSTMHGFIVVVGHGQFFSALQFGLAHGFTPTSEWMKDFRKWESTHPLKNGEIIKLCIK